MRFTKCVLLVSAMLGTAAGVHAAAIVTSASGANAAAIQASVDAYRTALGTLNPNVAGSFGTGRREINWDGVPDMFSAPNLFPGNFFNVNSPRGSVDSTPGSGLQVSSNAAVGQVRFDNINPTYSAAFQTFSAQRLFTSLGSNIVDVTFFVPGTTTASSTSAFGSVFADVDLPATTSIQYFDLNGISLGTFFVTAANNGLSFLGVQFNAGEQIGRVRITSGNSALGPNDSPNTDVVVMDDFIYAEPANVPEPGTWALLAGGMVALGRYRWQSRCRRP